MKLSLFVPFCLLLFLSVPSYAQDKPFKGATKIIVTVPDSTGVMQKIASVLYDNGYSIEREDAANGFISSTAKGLGKTMADMKIHAQAKGERVVLSAFMAINVIGQKQYDPLRYSGMKGSPIRVSWAELENVAKELGTDIKYEK